MISFDQKHFDKAERIKVLELVKSKHKTQEGLGDELYKVIKSTLDEYKWNTVNLVEYKTVLANKLANSRTAIRAQLQEADRLLNEYHDFTTELFSTGQLGQVSDSVRRALQSDLKEAEEDKEVKTQRN